MRRLLFLLLLAPLLGRAATLAQRIDRILADAAARRAFWGVKAVDLTTGRTLYEHNAERLFVPASTAKLFSTSLALVRLGPEYRWLTRVAATAPPDEDGRLAGDIVLIGGGDPNLSARVLPYDPQQEYSGNPFAALDQLAAEVAALGVRQIDGDVVGDNRRYVWQPYASGWAQEDTVAGYGAPVSALAVNDSNLTLRIRPAAVPGDAARVEIEPLARYYEIDNRVKTTGDRTPRRIRLDREPGSRTLRVWGEISPASNGQSQRLAVDDPALFAAEAFRDALLRQSITVRGRATSRHAKPHEFIDLENDPPNETPYTVVLASRSSMPLAEALLVILKVSQNLHAEMLLREVARQRRGLGSIEASLAEMKTFLSEIGIQPEQFSFYDGSGLSRRDLVAPAAIVRLLAYMWSLPHRDRWMEALPAAGLEGTLKGRFVGTSAAERLRAKTGTLAHVSALAGYFRRPGTRPIAFAVMVNNYGGNAAPVRDLIDRVCLALAGE